MMPRYIDADAMIRKICGMKCGCERYECGYDEAGCPKVRDLETAPTVSPDEVRGVGEWVGEYDGYYDSEPVWDMWSCSNCGEYFDEWDDKPTWTYCPSCGARMKGAEDGD